MLSPHHVTFTTFHNNKIVVHRVHCVTMYNGGVVKTLKVATPRNRTTHSPLRIFFFFCSCKYVVDSCAMMPARLWMIYIDFGPLITIVLMFGIYESLNNTFLTSYVHCHHAPCPRFLHPEITFVRPISLVFSFQSRFQVHIALIVLSPPNVFAGGS